MAPGQYQDDRRTPAFEQLVGAARFDLIKICDIVHKVIVCSSGNIEVWKHSSSAGGINTTAL